MTRDGEGDSKMVQKKILLFSSLALLLLVSSGGLMLQQIDGEKQEISKPKLNSAIRSIVKESTYHDPITVNNDTELAAVATSGMGSNNDPYITIINYSRPSPQTWDKLADSELLVRI